MFKLKKFFIALLSFRRSLAIKCACLSNQPCQIRPTLIAVNSIELLYYPFDLVLRRVMESVILLTIHMLYYWQYICYTIHMLYYM